VNGPVIQAGATRAIADDTRHKENPMPSIGPMELIVVLAIALIVLGPKRLPETGKSLGRGIREFKGALTRGDDEAAAPPTRD
jgi:sec-independent protein translocase protein TatA